MIVEDLLVFSPEEVVEMWRSRRITDDEYHAYLLERDAEEAEMALEAEPLPHDITDDQLESLEEALAEITLAEARLAALSALIRERYVKVRDRRNALLIGVHAARRRRNRKPLLVLSTGAQILSFEEAA
ncbi:MAG TPA: hypothetical protein VJS44_14060 [Pyrinomonadaceae bacterium]|nr:hypothetical protein [Pyrinomonadaceae bacterium]